MWVNCRHWCKHIVQNYNLAFQIVMMDITYDVNAANKNKCWAISFFQKEKINCEIWISRSVITEFTNIHHCAGCFWKIRWYCYFKSYIHETERMWDPSIVFSFSEIGSQRPPHTSSVIFQLIFLGDPKTFPSQMGHIISSTSSGSLPESPLS